MSIRSAMARPGAAEQRLDPADAALAARANGSLFGAAIGAAGAEGMWTSMAISPPRTPPSTGLLGASPPPFALEEILGDEPALPGETMVEAICTLHECDGVDSLALVRFSQELHASTLLSTAQPRVRNYDHVVAKPVVADALRWQPMNALRGSRGHVFELLHAGEVASRIEVSIGPLGRLERVAIVDAAYSPLAHASGMADASTMLVYDDPAERLRALRALGAQMRSDVLVGYLPTFEACVGPALDALTLDVRASSSSAVAAHTAWATTRRFLHEMSRLAADNADRHAAAELGTAAAGALAELRDAWKRVVV